MKIMRLLHDAISTQLTFLVK